MKDKKRAMGRGLGAILSAESKATINSATDEGADKFVGNIVEVAVEDIYPNPTQPRTYFDEKALNELAQSIKNLGVIQPVTLRKDGEKFEIISGERRYRASKMAGLATIPAYIRLVNDQELLEMALVENIQREDLDAVEIALTYQRLMDEIGLTQENLSQRVGKDRSTITNSIRLLRLSPDIQNAIRSGEISAGHGRAIISLDNEELQQILFEKIIKEHLNVRQSEQAAAILKNPKSPAAKKAAKAELPNHFKRAEKAIADLLDVKVEIKTAGNGKKGKIVLDFKNQEELDYILSHIK
ncbi:MULTISPECIES: ParB/RepB/Spo0J family partition protein [Chryseobacterium]|uniref:ParB family chromosome partitioning protein n=1 Tax=Chryseobacterium camelliae TaxID=1265445 RepID=A0ABU0TJA5_9FLAO|nr:MULTISPECIES: ParB/RepB/Spo0J family partition protein [Chryseobacterium]MDT3409003.1 ParB family chromosome partitioning protein [Pseudacidovorax intermedius]MDQ1097139.1 ParB family chromosome partitioning protein [Chryseobacterium camelliae]MDQ1101077.1 ParB family chromosome partitioning protein [Chryseobacterium sp. SORGH_AS_1048]MDR6084519.1 ParB family chromosome partitioning protein [Chryseobacterium sp. SORGH_AS_0909]MDR6132789.1 ParB family chromosome partitioning protein [Chryseo